MTTLHDRPRVLVAEDDPAARAFLVDNLTADGYEPICAVDSVEAIRCLAEPVDALLVDVNGNTLDVIDTVRHETWCTADPQIPIVVLTSHAGELHLTRLLDRGADDVIAKPYSYVELRARLAALLRRAHARTAPRMLRAGSLRLDVTSRRAWVGDVETERLSATEYQLLLTLIGEPARVFTRQELIRSVWGDGVFGRSRTLDSHASRLRRRLQIGDARYVRNVWGVGYRLVDGELHPTEPHN
jgi:DNA-binding response OmpR family regulator